MENNIFRDAGTQLDLNGPILSWVQEPAIQSLIFDVDPALPDGSTTFTLSGNIGTDNFNSQIALDQITSDIDLAQSIAFAKNDTITIVFSAENDNYKLYTGPDANRSIISDFPGSNDGIVSFASGRLASIDISSINFNNSNELQFLPLGNVKNGGSIQINSTTTITISDVTGKWSIN